MERALPIDVQLVRLPGPEERGTAAVVMWRLGWGPQLKVEGKKEGREVGEEALKRDEKRVRRKHLRSASGWR